MDAKSKSWRRVALAFLLWLVFVAGVWLLAESWRGSVQEVLLLLPLFCSFLAIMVLTEGHEQERQVQRKITLLLVGQVLVGAGGSLLLRLLFDVSAPLPALIVLLPQMIFTVLVARQARRVS